MKDHHPYAIANAAMAEKFALAGHACLTLVSKKTGERFTYQIEGKEDDKTEGPGARRRFNIWFVSVLYGPDNESDYAYLGFIKPDARAFIHGRKSKIGQSDPRNLAFEYFWGHARAGRIPPQLECWHEGRCGRCGRKLTVPSSIASGFGPECVAYV